MAQGAASKIISRVLFYMIVVLVTAILFFPLYWMFNTSLAARNDVFVYPPALIHPNAQLGSYVEVLTQTPILRWMANSAYVVLMVTVVSMTVSTMAAYSLSRFKRRGTLLVGWLLLGSRMLPTTLLVIPLFILMNRLGLLNTLYSVALADLVFIIPFSVWMLKGYFDSIPRDLEESAWIDGATRSQALIQIVMPLAAPGIAATALYGAILSWDEFVFARTFLTGNETWTISLGLAGFRGEYVTYWNNIMAASLIGTIPIVIVFLLTEKYLVSGLAAGAVKG